MKKYTTSKKCAKIKEVFKKYVIPSIYLKKLSKNKEKFKKIQIEFTGKEDTLQRQKKMG